MALEQTYNKEAKTQLFKGITQQQAIREKYQKALHALTAVSEQTEAVVHVSEGTGTPRRPAKTQASKDRDAVNNIQAIRENYPKALPALTAVSEQTEAVVHVNEGTGTPRRPAKTQASKDRDAVNNIQAIREKYHKALHALTAVSEQTEAVVGTCQ